MGPAHAVPSAISLTEPAQVCDMGGVSARGASAGHLGHRLSMAKGQRRAAHGDRPGRVVGAADGHGVRVGRIRNLQRMGSARALASGQATGAGRGFSVVHEHLCEVKDAFASSGTLGPAIATSPA